MLYLIASCIALLFGPLFYRFFSTGSGLQKGLDGFIFVSLGGLVLVHILPELLEHGGILTLAFVMVGLWGPSASEKLFHQYSSITHNITLTLGIAGLLLHTVTDGGAMALAQHEDYSILLALGVIIHRLPVGLAIWWLLKPQVGSRWAMIVLAGMMLLTCAGYFASEQFMHQISLENTAYLQAFVTGSILHVVLHQPHNHPDPDSDSDKKGKYEYQAGIGSLLGLGLLALLLLLDSNSGHEHHHHHDHSFDQLLDWLLLVAPYLILCYAVAALRFHFNYQPNHPVIAVRWMQRILGPEALILSFALLGPVYSLIHLVAGALLIAFLSWQQVSLTDPHDQLPNKAVSFGFAHIVDRSAPWIVFSIIVANVIGHPSLPFSTPWLQVALLLCVFLPLRLCNLGAAVLAVSLALSGWEAIAIIFALIAAPLVSISQFKLMSSQQIFALLALIFAILTLGYIAPLPVQQTLALPSWLNAISLAIVSILFAASLLRLGPRQFLARLMIKFRQTHHHH
ncbi:metal transporter [Shewanella maritima]|uniref:metal transporter n=1 Tax=Shewanella maritima TaxID=2520507 RepID=UPI003735C263